MIEVGSKLWYREPWPWILMAGPVVVIVAGAATLILAIGSDDGLVVDDYYRQGLAINRTLVRDQRAKDLGVTAVLNFTPSRDRVSIAVEGNTDRPAAYKLSLVHGTRKGQDQILILTAMPDGGYGAFLRPVHGAGWRAILEDDGGGWRLTGEWSGASDRVELVAAH